MKLIQEKTLTRYSFNHLSSYGISHGVFTKKGGVSRGLFKGLNVSFKSGDKQANVEQNRKLIASLLPQIDSFVVGNLTHGTNICEIYRPPKGWSHFETKADGLITCKENIALCMTHADCQIAFFFDPRQKIIACVHCGWRGNVQNIYLEMAKKFLQKGSRLCDVLVGISPSLGPKHSEFINYQKEFPSAFLPFRQGKNHFNLWEISSHQLTTLGFLEKNIEIARVCTYSHQEDFYSYRRDKITGRNLSFIAL